MTKFVIFPLLFLAFLNSAHAGESHIWCASPWATPHNSPIHLKFLLGSNGLPTKMISTIGVAVGHVNVIAKVRTVSGQGDWDGEWLDVEFNRGTKDEVLLSMASPEYKTTGSKLYLQKGSIMSFPQVTNGLKVTVAGRIIEFGPGFVTPNGLISGMSCNQINE